jgi:hypothetical protein
MLSPTVTTYGLFRLQPSSCGDRTLRRTHHSTQRISFDENTCGHHSHDVRVDHRGAPQATHIATQRKTRGRRPHRVSLDGNKDLLWRHAVEGGDGQVPLPHDDAVVLADTQRQRRIHVRDCSRGAALLDVHGDGDEGVRRAQQRQRREAAQRHSSSGGDSATAKLRDTAPCHCAAA